MVAPAENYELDYIYLNILYKYIKIVYCQDFKF